MKLKSEWLQRKAEAAFLYVGEEYQDKI